MSSRSSSPRRCSTCPQLIVPLSRQPVGLGAVDPAQLQNGTKPLYLVVYFLLIIFFTYFYVAITFNPVEVADNMKKYGGFIPGIRAGKPTAEYLDYVLTPHHAARARSTWPSIAIIPFVAFAFLGVGQSFLFGGTSLLIMVGVGLDTVKQIESPAAAAQLRRVPAVMRAHPDRPARCGQGHPGAVVAERSASRTSPPATSSAPTWPAAPRSGSRPGSTWTAASTCPTRSPTRWSRDRLAQPDAADGFLLDGYPRTLDAGRRARRHPGRPGHALDAVVEITVDADEVTQRLLRPRAKEGRADDTEDVIRRRLEVYAEQTAPHRGGLLRAALLVQVDGMGTVDEVHARSPPSVAERAAGH